MDKRKHSDEVYREAQQVIPGGVSRNTIFRNPYPNYAQKASGCYITDIDGTRRIDFANNMAALIHGHGFKPVIDAVIRQLKRGTAYTLASEIEVAYAEHLVSRSPSFEKIRFMNSGTEAVMAMIKAARAFTGKFKIAKAEGAYHGTYDFAEVSQTANPSNWGTVSEPRSVPHAHGTPPSVTSDVVIFPYNDLEHTLHILDKHADDIACVIIDPVPHRVGLMRGEQRFVEGVYRWTRKNNALFVFDEVVTFRVNYGGAQEDYPVCPDLTAMGKIIGGGFPVGAVAGRADVMQVFDPHEKNLLLPYSGTFSANPITMTAGSQAMLYFDRDEVKKINALAQLARNQVREVIHSFGLPLSITGAGSMFRIHLKRKAPTTYREAYLGEEGKVLLGKILDHMYYKEKILLINTLTCMLSTVMGHKEIDRLTEGFSKTFKKYRKEIEDYVRVQQKKQMG